MKSVLMISAHSPGIDRRIIAEANTLAGAGYRVTLLSFPIEAAAAGLANGVDLILTSPYTPAPPRAPKPGLWTRAKGAAKAVLPSRAHTLAHAVYLRWRKHHDRIASVFLRSAPRRSFDVIHCHDLDTLPAAIALRDAVSSRAAIVYDAHELFPFHRPERAFQSYWEAVERRHIPQVNLVITVNPLIASDMAERYGIETPEVIYNSYGVDSEALVADARRHLLSHFGMSDTDVIVLYQGRLGAHHNLDVVVRAFGELDDRFQLLLLGDGPMKQSLQDIAALSGKPNVRFSPAVPQAALLNLTRGADIGLVPYSGDTLLNNRYATPNKLFEYIEAGVPICASDLPELRRIVEGMGIGGAYQMDTPARVAQAISDCDLRRRAGEFSAAAMAKARGEFGWDRQGAHLLRLYDRLVRR